VTEAERIEAVYAARARTLPAARDSLLHPGNLLIAQERAQRFLDGIVREGLAPLAGRAILDVGCGTGQWLRELIHWGADPERLCGVDLLPDRIAIARTKLPASVGLEPADGVRLPFDDARFDLVLQSTVFSSILDGVVRRRVAAEMQRVLRPGGLIVWYDARVRSPGNRSFAGIGGGEIAALFPGWRVRLTSLTLAPPLVRWLAPRSLAACQLLARVPILRTHWLAFIRADYLQSAKFSVVQKS
jgi:SAM-dependent methyltransferase